MPVWRECFRRKRADVGTHNVARRQSAICNARLQDLAAVRVNVGVKGHFRPLTAARAARQMARGAVSALDLHSTELSKSNAQT